MAGNRAVERGIEMVICSYNADTGEVVGFRDTADEYPTPPPLPYILITEDERRQYFVSGSRMKVGITLEPPKLIDNPETLNEKKAGKLAALDRAAAQAYVSGFYSEATGTKLYYDSDTETQRLIAGLYAATKEPDWETKMRYPGVAPAGKAPIRARVQAEDLKSSKTVQLLDATQLKALVEDLDAHLFKVKSTLWQKQTEVETAYQTGNIDEIQKVTWPL